MNFVINFVILLFFVLSYVYNEYSVVEEIVDVFKLLDIY